MRPWLKAQALAALCVLLGTVAGVATAAMADAGKLASTPAPAPPKTEEFPYGVAWYPEWYPEAEWDRELATMREANITFVRIAEFAWAKMEPSEGHYDFGWLDRAIAKASAHGLKVIIGTPTAAPPIWLTSKYPEVLAVEADGRRTGHGWRRQFSAGSSLYRRKAAGIAAKLAERYGRNPTVIGFQIDNEYGRETYDAETRGRFQNWLRAKYGTVERMNAAHFATYWSQTYGDFGQVDIPGQWSNPALHLDWLRFFSDLWRDYQKNQIDAMRPFLAPHVFVTTNYVAKYDEFDFSVPAQDLDVVGWAWYFEEPRLNPAEGGMLHDLYRGFLGKNPWVLETAPGNMNYAERNYTEARGLARAKLWQAIGHGADGYAFWVFRPPLNGPETFHGSLVDAGGRPRPVFAETREAGREAAAAWRFLSGTSVVADAAILHDYPSRWSIKKQSMTKDYDPWQVHVRFHGALSPHVAGIDVLRGTDRLERYRLVVAPALHILTAAEASRLTAYVRGGGHLVLGPRAGVKNESNSLWPQGSPGPLGDLLGARIDIAEVLPSSVQLQGELGTAKSSVWAERITETAPGLHALLRYGVADGWLDGAPGVATRRVGKGRITYVGALLDGPGLNRVMAWAASSAGLEPLFPQIPKDVEVMAREGNNGRAFVVINWGAGVQTVELPRPMTNAIDGERLAKITLKPLDVAVLAQLALKGKK